MSTDAIVPAVAPATPPATPEVPPKAEAKSADGQSQLAIVVAPAHGSEGGGDLKAYAEFASAAASILWPLLILVALLMFRAQLAKLLESAGSLKLGPLELTRQVSALTSKVESLQVDKEVLTAAALEPHAAAAASRLEAKAPDTSALEALATEYEHVKIRSHSERVRKKDMIAAQMATLVIHNGISRDWLAQQTSEGLLMALATTIHTLPMDDDGARLLSAGPNVKRLHVRYRFMMAVSRLAQTQLLNHDAAAGFLHLCELYRDGADGSLNERIDRTIAAIRQGGSA